VLASFALLRVIESPDYVDYSGGDH